MDTIDRRTILATGALALAGAAAQSKPAAAQAGPKPMFPVAAIIIPIVGEADVFQVRRIYCIGATMLRIPARWLGPDARAAVLLPETDRCDSERRHRHGRGYPYPSLTKNYHYEVELVAALKSGGTNIPVERRSTTSTATRWVST